MRKIKLVHEQAEYDAMTASSSSRQQNSKNIPFGFRNSSVKNVNVWQSSAERSEKEEWEEVRRQLGAIFNVALSVGAVAVATWWAAGNADPIWVSVQSKLDIIIPNSNAFHPFSRWTRKPSSPCL